MFHGSIPPVIQSIIYETVKTWKCSDVYVGCSGNFTIERTIFDLGKSLHSCDVTIYSNAIGNYLAGEKVDIKFNEEHSERYGFLNRYMSTDLDRLATLMTASQLAQTVDKDNAYYNRLVKAYLQQWDKLHAKTKNNIEKCQVQLVEYFAGDALEFIKRSPKNAGVVSYPPFDGAAKAFSRDFEKLGRLFHWAEPEYEYFTQESIKEYYAELMKHDEWLFATNMRLPEYEEYLKGMSRTTNRGVPIYVYSNYDKTRITVPNQTVERVPFERLLPNEEIGENIRLEVLSSSQFSAVRSQYMNINIRPGQATMAIGVLVDEKLIGVYAFSASPTLSNWDSYIETPSIYLLSDFPVAPTDYDRLAKLVIYAALSKESKVLAEQSAHKRIRSLVTTAFSKNPISMKYRGILKLLNRKENHAQEESWGKDIPMDDPYYGRKYSLNYGGMMGEWTLKEGLEIWRKKHSHVKNTGKVEGD